MKQQVMSLRKAIKEKHISIGVEEIRYQPDYAEIEVIPKRTGVNEKQKFKTNNFSWKLIELENRQLALIPMGSTNQILTLQGKIGAEKSKKTLNFICNKLWSSKKLNLEAKVIEIADYEQMSADVKQTIKNVWLGGHHPIDVKGNFVETVYYVGETTYEKESYPLYSKKYGPRSLNKGILPIIYLPNEMLIDLSTKIIFRERHQFAKYKLSMLIEESTLPDEIISELKEILELMKNL